MKTIVVLFSNTYEPTEFITTKSTDLDTILLLGKDSPLFELYRMKSSAKLPSETTLRRDAASCGMSFMELKYQQLRLRSTKIPY
jgi:hypothetical protein